MRAMDAQRRLAEVHAPEFFKMDESTQQLLTSFRLQLKPIEARQVEILEELRSWRDKMHTMETQSALSQDRIKRYEQDLNRGLASIREEMDEKIDEMDERIKGRNKALVPIAGALATLTTILIALFLYWIKT